MIQEETPAYSRTIDSLWETLSTTDQGLSSTEAKKRLERVGRNTLPKPKPPHFFLIFLRQFLNPFIYILLFAGSVSLIVQHLYDAIFIFAVLLSNAIIGSIQEHLAERSAEALRKITKTHTRVIRGGEEIEIDAEELVPGDLIVLHEGDKIPADIRLIFTKNLTINESLLTGESAEVLKDAYKVVEKETYLSDRVNMAYAGTLITRGFGRGIVTATGLSSEVGSLSESIEKGRELSASPLIIRMKKFTKWIGVGLIGAIIAIFLVEFLRGASFFDVFILSVALAVSAIPSGLPIALTIALSIGVQRMAKRHVIVKRLVAVEALGSCTYIATDKTGTLTLNELTVEEICLPQNLCCKVTGKGIDPKGVIFSSTNNGTPIKTTNSSQLKHLILTAALCNDASLTEKENEWTVQGDMVDAALLVLTHKAGEDPQHLQQKYKELAEIPYESERQFAASVHMIDEKQMVFVKGAIERLLPMCTTALTEEGVKSLQTEEIEKQVKNLAKRGYRVVAMASGLSPKITQGEIQEKEIQGLTFLGVVGMVDPLRPEAKEAVEKCTEAGITASMVTGDHPETALAIAKQLHLAERMDQVMTGKELYKLQKSGTQELDNRIRNIRVFARIEPKQKKEIIQSLKRIGHFVAVTGDGANDAPALSSANVGVVMGKRGTEVAKECAELMITDDNFASIIAGIKEGRVAYSNIRNVIFLLLSTGAAEVVAFILALLFNLPLPLLATQLLWLNIVTNGIQDVALAFEPAEGSEMQRSPRSPKERIFNALMIKRTLLSGAFIGAISFMLFKSLWDWGWDLVSARNSTLLLLVLFENVQVFNSRSETLSAFKHNPLKNPLLFFGVILVQLLHIGAMHTPILSKILQIQPISFSHWLTQLGLASTLLFLMEGEKWLRKRKVDCENIEY
jgi:Ca2+-transporting ATPase